jgi:predicted NBD/HSP70 family sugar kinase
MRSSGELRHNLAQVILLIRSERAKSRRAISKELGVAAATSGLYADLLIEAGFLSESGFEQGPMGRPKRTLTLLAHAGWFAGVEFHAERVQAVRVDFSGKITASLERALPHGIDASAAVGEVADIVEQLATDAPGPLLAVGVGAPGVVDPLSGVGREYRFIAQWRDVAITEALRARFAVPVELEHNLRAVALAERWFGGGRDLNDFVCLGLRSGFGAGIIAGGRLVCGTHHAAGELGRWPWPAGSGQPARELQESLSAPAIFRRVNELAPSASIPTDLRTAFAHEVPPVRIGDAVSTAWQPVIAELAPVLACLQLLLDPDVFFLHGPLTVLGADFCDAVTAAAREFSAGTTTAPLRLLPSTLGPDAGALGAASLAMERWEPALKTPSP